MRGALLPLPPALSRSSGFRSDPVWSTRLETQATVTCTAATFTASARLQAFEGEEPVFGRQIDDLINRSAGGVISMTMGEVPS